MAHKLCDPFPGIRIPYSNNFFWTTGSEDSASRAQSVDTALRTLAVVCDFYFLDFAFAVEVPEDDFTVEAARGDPAGGVAGRSETFDVVGVVAEGSGDGLVGGVRSPEFDGHIGGA